MENKVIGVKVTLHHGSYSYTLLDIVKRLLSKYN